MAGMRIVVRGGSRGALAAALLAPAGAQAGTYDVVSCGAPGANGRNNSLEYAATSFDPQYAAPGAAAGTRATRAAPTGWSRARARSTAPWRNGSPAPTGLHRARRAPRSSAFTSWRFGEARDQGGDDPNTPLTDEGDHWRVEVVDHTGQPVGGPGGGETCGHPLGSTSARSARPAACAPTTGSSTSQLRWQITCGGEIVGGCPTSYGGYPLATMVVYGTQRDAAGQQRPDARRCPGRCSRAGWRRPSDAVDLLGVGQLRASAAPRSRPAPPRRATAASCDFTYTVPCANAAGGALRFPGPLPDGRYPIRLTVTDAAGNPRVVAGAGRGRRHPAGGRSAAPAGPHARRRARRTSPPGSPRGQIAVRNSAAEPYRPLADPVPRRARWWRGSIAATRARSTSQVAVRDNAGNERDRRAGAVPRSRASPRSGCARRSAAAPACG